jgi:NF-X1-type zinc finger protein NFXL1
MVHISGTLGPVSGSGEVHVAKIVANDARITGSIRAGYTGINGGNVLLITNSGSSDAIRITGGMTASHAVHVEHLYTNDLYVSGTAYGITVDRANYASASDPSTTRTYSPTGLETSGYLKVSGSSILGDTALDTVMVTGSFEASGPAHFNGTADFYGAARHHGTLRADDAVTFTDTLFAQGGVVFGNQSTDTAQVTGSFEVSGPSHFTSEVHAEGQVTVGGEAFLNGAVNVSGSTILGAANTTHQITGSFEVAGPANFTSVVNAEADLTVAGNTTLGNNSEDTVQITGSLEVSNTVNATELINAEKGVTAHNHLNVTGSLEASGATFLTSTATVGGLLTVNDSTILGDAGANEHQITGSVDIAHTLDVEGVLTVNDSTFLGEANENVHQITGSVHMGLTLDVTGAVGVGGTLTSYSDFRATDNTHIGASNGNTHQVSGTVHVSNTMDVSGAVGVMTDLRVWGNSTFGKAAGYSHQFTGSLDLANNINVTGTINAAGAIKSYDTLDVASGTFSMPDNTSAKILVADGNSYQEVAVSGDVTIASNGAVSIANDAVDTNQIADDAIEAGQIADGAIGNAAVDNASLRADKLDITNSTDIGEAIADDDVMIVGNTSASANRKSAMSRVKAYTKTDVGTIGTAEASKAIIVDNNVAINGGLTSVTGSKDLYFKDVKATSNLISDGGLLVSGSATVAAGLTSSYGMSIPDHEMLRIGSSSDLKISHNTTNTLFINQAGHLRFDNQATGKHIQMDLAADDATTQFQVRNNAGTELFSIDTVGTAVTGTLEVSSTTNLQATNLYGAASGSSTLAIQGSASFGAPVDISGDLVFHAATIAGRIDIKVNDGAGADTAIQIGKNGIVTKIGDDTPSDGQYLSWDNTAGKVAWADGLTSWGMSGSDNHYSSTELRTSGDLKVSGSVTFAGAQTGGYSVDGAEIKFGADEEIKLIHNADSGLILKRTATGADVPVTLTLQTGETQISNNNVIGKIQWQAPDESDGSDGTLVCAAIEALATDSFSATVNSTKLAFKTATDGAAVRHLELHADGKLQGYASNSATWSVTADGTGSYQQLAIADKLLHTGDADTGIFFEADSIKLHAGTNSQPQITINGTGVVINEESNSLDFRIESNQQTHMFAIDGGDNEITIANGFGSSGITIAQTGSMAMDGHLHAVGEIVCGSDLHVSDDAFITDDLNVGGDIDVVGSVTAPSANFTNCGVADDITHIGDPNTKITFGTDQIDLIAGGITMLTLDETTTNAIHFFAGSGSGGGTIYESGNLKVDGDLYLGGADIRDGGGGVLLSFDGAGIIDNACEFSQDITIATSAAAQLSLKSDSGQSSVDFYGRGDSMSDGDNVGALRFYGTEANDGANSALTAMMIVETAESGWAYGSSLATRMRFQVGRDGETGVHDGLTIDGSVANVSYPHIGIGTTTPTYKLSVQASVGSSYIAQVRQESSNASAACLRIRSANASGGNFITFSDDGGSNKGHITVNGSTVTYGAFTGYHPAALPAADHDTGYEYGTIVKIASVDSTTHEKSVGYNVEKTATSQDKAVLGVCAGKMSESLNDDGSPDRESGLHQIFAVGDGHILACSEGGNIETGDFICSSNTAGYGMLQSDDLLHNYTVARASEPVDWSAEDSNTKLIACTYHAG